MRFRFAAPLLALLFVSSAVAQEAPRENPYDVLGKLMRPFLSVLLVGGQDPNKAMVLEMKISQVTGRLPKEFEGATLRAAVQFPDKVKLEAPVLGEPFTVCRNGAEVWATPGQKVSYLLDQFKLKPRPTNKASTPLFLPFTAQQAVFLVALFTMENPNVAEMDELNGEACRIITTSLMPELSKAAKAEDFKAQIWIGSGYQPRRVEISRKDFSAVIDVTTLKFSEALPASEWVPAPGVTDVYRTKSEYLEQLLYVVMNSLQSKAGDKPWLNEK